MMALLLLQSCSHGGLNQQLDHKLAEEGAITTRADLNTETGQLIESAPGLTLDQKTKLSALKTLTQNRVDSIHSQSLKLQSVLIKDLVSTHYDEDEVSLIQSRMKSLEEQRLTLLFDAVKQANTLLDRESLLNRALIGQFFEGHTHGD